MTMQKNADFNKKSMWQGELSPDWVLYGLNMLIVKGVWPECLLHKAKA